MTAPKPRRSSVLNRMLAWIDDALPMSPHDRAERDWVADGEADARGREGRLKQHMLEMRGKGGYR